MPCPATRRTDIAAVCRLVAVEARRAGLAGVGWVYPFHRDARPLRFVGDEGGELVERPGGDQPVVFAGLGRLAAISPAACACGVPDRPLTDTGESFQADDTHTLCLGMRDDTMRELVVGVAHPAPLFALALALRMDLLRSLKLLALGIELAALRALLPAVAEEARAFADDMYRGGDLHAHVPVHDALTGGRFQL